MRKKFIYLEAGIKGYYKHIKDINKNLFYSFWELMEEVGYNFEVDNEKYINIIDELVELGNVVVGDYNITLDNQNADNLVLLKEAKKELEK
jgi:hypothetical protein